MYTGLRLDYRLWAPTSASRAVSAAAELLVYDWRGLCDDRAIDSRDQPRMGASYVLVPTFH